MVTFRLRLVHGPAHALFRAESLLNTSLFAGFPGFTSKLRLAHDEHDRYRGVYEWDGWSSPISASAATPAVPVPSCRPGVKDCCS